MNTEIFKKCHVISKLFPVNFKITSSQNFGKNSEGFHAYCKKKSNQFWKKYDKTLEIFGKQKNFKKLLGKFCKHSLKELKKV